MINKQDVLDIIDNCISKIEDAFTADEAEVILRIARSKIADMAEVDANEKQYCYTCKWYDLNMGICTNGDNDYTDLCLDDSCSSWEESVDGAGND